MHRTAIQRQAFNGAAHLEQDRAAWGFVNTARLHADETVFHDIQTADPIAPTHFIQLGQQGGRAHLLPIDCDRIARFKINRDLFGLVRCILGRHHARQDQVHIGGNSRIFQDFPFGGNVQQIGVLGEGRFAALVLGNRNLMMFGIGDQFCAGIQIPFAPGGDDLDVRLQRVIAEFKADLVIAFAGRAMGNRIGTHHLGNFNLALGNQRARDGGAQQIRAFILSIGAKHGEDIVAHKFFAQVFDEDLLDPHHLGFLAGRLQFFTLPQIGGEGHNLTAIGVLQPAQDDRGIQATGICQYDLINVFFHASLAHRFVQ